MGASHLEENSRDKNEHFYAFNLPSLWRSMTSLWRSIVHPFSEPVKEDS